jgi:hypothetical protein
LWIYFYDNFNIKGQSNYRITIYCTHLPAGANPDGRRWLKFQQSLELFCKTFSGTDIDVSKSLKGPKCEIFDLFFYTNKFYLGLEVWKFFTFF